MSDIEAPLRYSEPVVDRPGRGGKVGFLLVVALGIAVAAVGLALEGGERQGQSPIGVGDGQTDALFTKVDTQGARFFHYPLCHPPMLASVV